MTTTENRETKEIKEISTNGATPTTAQPATSPTASVTLPTPVLKPSMFLNRELSLLDFHTRVLEEAMDERNFLLERLRFLSIFGSNMDEFFMIRVAGIREQVETGVTDLSLDGMSPTEELTEIHKRVTAVLEKQRDFYCRTLQPALAKQGVHILDYGQLTAEQKRAASEYFDRMVFPVCTPLAVDPGHPFPHISNLSLNMAVELQDPNGQKRFARVKVPSVLPRLVQIPVSEEQARNNTRRSEPVAYVWLEQVLAANLSAFFPQMTLLEVHPFRVIRDADIEIQEMEADDLLETIEQSLVKRRFGSAVALFVNHAMPEHLRALLAEKLELDPGDIYVVDGPLGFSDLSEIYRLDRPDLKDASFTPRTPAIIRNSNSIFYAIQQGDILLHHPYDSFAPVVDFIRSAAQDQDVLAIKQTLYRVGNHSPIVEALLEAAEQGKQVAVLVELKARGDEENNIEWARALEQAGVHVTYGLIGLKTHCKAALVVRKEGDGIRRYVHLGTGNYNPATARGYTDIGLLTCNPDFGADASELFNYLTGYSKQTRYRKLLVAPISMRAGLVALIEREAKRQRDTKDGRIIWKVNHVVDPIIIEALYRASQAGVQIDLMIRGMCSLRPGLAKVSENIKVTRIVGRFLEHSRIFYFANGGKADILVGSADMMPRNLDHRVEVLFPIEDESLRQQVVHDILEVYLRDNMKSSLLGPNGKYVRRTPGSHEAPFEAQAVLVNQGTGEGSELTIELAALPKRYRKHLTELTRESQL